MDGNESTARHGGTASGATPHKDHFLQLMFFRASPSEVRPHEPVPRTGDYAPLPTFRTRTGHRFNLPAPSAPAVLKEVVDAGIKAVLNFSPGALKVPADVKVKSVDLTVSLESLSFFLAQGDADGE